MRWKKNISSIANKSEPSANRQRCKLACGPAGGIGNDTDYADDITAGWQTRENSVIEPRWALRPAPVRFRLCDFYVYTNDHKVELVLHALDKFIQLTNSVPNFYDANANTNYSYFKCTII